MEGLFQKYLIFLGIVAVLSSCRAVPLLYVPNNLNMPLMGNKGELKVDVFNSSSSGSGSDGYKMSTDGYGLNVSYAIDSNLLVYADGFEIRTNGIAPYQNSFHYLTNAGIGYYKRLGGHGRVELLGGLGYGSTNSSTKNIGLDSIENLNITANIFSMTVQSDIGYVSRGFDCGLGVRLTDLMPTGNYTAIYTDTSNKFLSHRIMPMTGSALLLEPGLMIGIGMKYVKLNFEIGLLYQLSGLKVDPYYGPLYNDGFLTVGLTMNLFRDYDFKNGQ